MESTKEYDFWQSEDSSINTVFKNVVLKNPNSIAIVDSEIILTYQELDELSNHLTGYLQSLDIDKNKPIAVYLNKSYHYIIACLAILKLGTAYLNIEIGYTSEFLIEILKDRKSVV